MAFTAYNPNAWKNPIVKTGDAGIHFSTTTNGFFIAPYSASASGLRMATSGVVSVNSSEVITKATNIKNVQWLGYYATSTTKWDDPFFFFNTTSSISKVLVGVKDGSLNGNIYYGTSQTAASSSLFKLFSSDIAITATTTPACYAVATSTACPNAINASSTPGIHNVLRFTASSASTTALTATVYYTPLS